MELEVCDHLLGHIVCCCILQGVHSAFRVVEPDDPKHQGKPVAFRTAIQDLLWYTWTFPFRSKYRTLFGTRKSLGTNAVS